MAEDKKLNILVIVGTVRQGRNGRNISDWYLREAKKVAPAGMNLELLDLADLDLPLFNEAATPSMGQYNPIQKQLAAKIGVADGFVFVTGEYNHGIPGSLKNFLDYISAEWFHKAAAFVGYGSSGGVRAIEQLIQVLAELRVASVAKSGDNVVINAPWEALNDDGSPKPGYQHGDIGKQLAELAWWASALKAARP